jgi:hypothetical protein
VATAKKKRRMVSEGCDELIGMGASFNAAITPHGKLTGEKPPGNPEGSLDKCSKHLI